MDMYISAVSALRDGYDHHGWMYVYANTTVIVVDTGDESRT